MKIQNNKNISIYQKDGHTCYVIQPYTWELNIDYVAYWLKKIIPLLNLGDVVSADGYNMDGLDESNIELLKNGFQLYDNYSGEFRNIKPLE